jgi:integrase
MSYGFFLVYKSKKGTDKGTKSGYFSYINRVFRVRNMGLYYRLDHKKNTSLQDKKEEVRVVIDYYYNGKRTKITTGVSCLVKDWDKNWRKKTSKNPIKSTDTDHRSKNLLIKNKLDEVNGVVLTIQKQDKDPIVELVKSYLRKDRKEKKEDAHKEIHFLPLFVKYEKWIKGEYNPQRESTKRGVMSSIKQIIEYTTQYQNKNNTLLFPDEINRDWVYGFIKWCYKIKGLKPSTINKRIKVLSSFSSWCKEKYNTTFTIKKPKNVFLGNDENLDIVFLYRDEVIKLHKYDKFDYTNKDHEKILSKEKRLSYIDDKWLRNDGKERKRTYTTFEVYKDMLLFLCNVGCRWGDMVKMKVGDLQYDDDKKDPKLGYKRGMITFYMEKIRVQKEPVKVPRNRLVYEIWTKYSNGKHGQHYLFPRTNYGNEISNNKFNKYIKDVCRIIGLNRTMVQRDWNLVGSIEKEERLPLWSLVSSHIGRRTFIWEQVQRGVPTRVIMSMTGQKSRKVFDMYYEVKDKEKKLINDDLFLDHLEKKSKTSRNKPPQKTPSPFSKEQKIKIEKLKYSLDEGWINQNKFDELFQKIIVGD